MFLSKDQIDTLLLDYIPESKTESLINGRRDEVEVVSFWNTHTSRWGSEEDAKEGFILSKLKENLKKLLSNGK